MTTRRYELLYTASKNPAKEQRALAGYNAEAVVSSRGSYIYHCVCGTTSFGRMDPPAKASALELACTSPECGLRISEPNAQMTGPTIVQIKFDS